MQRSSLLLAALLWCCPAVHATAPTLRIDSAPYQEVHSGRMAELAPSLRQWVVAEGRRSADSDPDVEAIGESVRTRLSGQAYSDGDVDVLVQLVLMECARDANADLRALIAEMKASNERKRALRESDAAAAQASQAQEAGLRDSYQHRTQMQPPVDAQVNTPSNLQPRADLAQIDAELVEPVEVEKDSLSELSEEQQLRLQMYQDRLQKAMEVLSNLIKKNSETASSITSNLK